MAVGPVDVMIIGFPGNRFTGRIAPAIMEQVDKGTIRILDLLFVSKDDDGTVTVIEAEDLGPEGGGLLEIDVFAPGALGPDDADEVSEDLPAGSSAMLIAFENTWAAAIAAAMLEADGIMIDQIRIPADVIEAVVGDAVTA
jgi:Family of unknown function (DUF6325)